MVTFLIRVYSKTFLIKPLNKAFLTIGHKRIDRFFILRTSRSNIVWFIKSDSELFMKAFNLVSKHNSKSYCEKLLLSLLWWHVISIVSYIQFITTFLRSRTLTFCSPNLLNQNYLTIEVRYNMLENEYRKQRWCWHLLIGIHIGSK